jgi:hypothetical protein
VITCYLRYVIDRAWRFQEETRCVVSFERSFLRPIFEEEKT